MVYIQRLRLSGFKSFVEKTELDIGNGLNGIVGPNGCGKSNLVEALRWVMGENSARRMRGDGMDDVIFAGTSHRPARAIAEVSVLLDNSDGTAPTPFQNSAQIEVTRRIERDKGSQYLVNGKSVRARDVQMLFADSMTGAHSPALVSQGRVTTLIQAKPTERRQMLEESAGVASLYTRRNEAELRLKAAAENLEKLDLVLHDMTARAVSLRAQAKQALRYRDLSDTIRRLNMVIAWQEWTQGREKLKREEQKFAESDRAIGQAILAISQLTRAHETAAEALETLRQQEAEARASLQLHRQTLEALERDEARRARDLADLQAQYIRAEADTTRNTEQVAQSNIRIDAIKSELAALAHTVQTSPDTENHLALTLSEAQAKVQEAEKGLLEHRASIQQARAAIDAATRALQTVEAEYARYNARLATLEQEYKSAEANNADAQALADMEAKIATFKDNRDNTQKAITAAETEAECARSAHATNEDTLAKARQELSSHARELKTLQDLLNRLMQGLEGSALLGLDVPAEYATALARAAGELAMRATMSSDGSSHWHDADITGFAPTDWPADVTPLISLIDAPKALQAFLSSIGIVASFEDGSRLCAQLLRGQILVSLQGALWRWDGLKATPEKEIDRDAHIMTLRQQIKNLEASKDTLALRVTEAESACNESAKAKTTSREVHQTLVTQLRSCQQDIETTECSLEQMRTRAAARLARLSLLQTQRDDTAAKILELATQKELATIALAQAQQADILQGHDAHVAAREDLLASARLARDEAQTALAALRAQMSQTAATVANLNRELARLETQNADLSTHALELSARMTDIQSRLHDLQAEGACADADAQRNILRDKIQEAETLAHHAADIFVTNDKQVKELAAALKAAEEQNIQHRERRAVQQATITALQADIARICADIEETYNLAPSHLEEAVLADWPEGAPSANKARDERDGLSRDREAMGPVNLRADVELGEIEGEFNKLTTEKDDLTQAIERLHQGIGRLNAEARERLMQTFDSVNTHFQTLFKQLFGGGEAYLKLTYGADQDPLHAGLEIFAQPPGKSLQSLTLLSGGEQTLTALALIFAMFLSNPAPVCVLDEVDAPLDDANVDRVCTLLESMAKTCATRFLVITHHRMTMARMSRLYGVTMAERGVSQLVSVNLALQGDLLANTTEAQKAA